MFTQNMMAGFLILIFSFSHNARAQDIHVALVRNVSGDVKIICAQSDIVATVGTQLLRSDVVVSGPKSSSGIVFRDGTLLTVGASTELEISRYVFQPAEAKYDFSVYLRKGEAIYSSGKIGKLSPESVSVNTPKSTVGVRGTRFIVKVD